MKKIIKRIENKFIAKKTPHLDRTPMWFLSCSEEELLARQDLNLDVRQALVSLRNDGFAVLKNNIPHNLCDALVEDFNHYCATHPEAAKYADAHGLHSRLALFHYESEPAMQVATLANTTAVVKAAFDGDFNIVGSLFFEKGSTQDVHRDTPAFFTNPLNHFFGVWNALEDIQTGSGELCYFRGGHKLARDADLYDDPSVTISNYFSVVEKACLDAGLKLEKFTPHKGDTLIWLPELPHGGSPRDKVGSSRRSMVFHYLPCGTPIHGVNEFFDAGKPLFVHENYAVRVKNGVRLIDMGEVRFYHNHKEGNFEEG
jgi:hypothetical protein